MSSFSKIGSALALTLAMTSAFTQAVEPVDAVFQKEAPLLKDANPDVRIRTIQEISGARTEQPAAAEEAFRMLLPLLQDTDADVQEMAASKVGLLGYLHPQHAKEALDALLPLLRETGSETRYGTVEAVTMLIDKVPDADLASIFPALLPILEIDDWAGQELGITGLGQLAMACENYVTPVLEALEPQRDSGWDKVRSSLVDMMAMVGMARAESRQEIIDFLEPLSNDPEKMIRANVATLQEAFRNPPPDIAAGLPSRTCPPLPSP